MSMLRILQEKVSMQSYVCEKCGSTSFVENNTELICTYCRTRYTPSTGNNNATSSIALNQDITELLKKIETDPVNAKKYANLILDLDANNIFALSIVGR